ncbi:MAG: hypothetical protein WAS21_25230 [Geminicoccaceae bacterium]
MAVPLLAPRSARQTDPEWKLRRLRRQYLRVTQRLERVDRLRRLRRRAVGAGPPLLVVALIALAGFATLILTSPWPLGLTLRHLAAAPSCSLARSVGLAPARHDQPVYWDWHDPDLDGWSCASLPGGRDRGFWVLRWW